MTTFYEPTPVRFQTGRNLPTQAQAVASTPRLPAAPAWSPAPCAPAAPAPVMRSTRSVTALLELIGQVRARELADLRREFNASARGGWGIIFDPGQACWIAVRGRHTTVYAATAQELRERIVSGVWRTIPSAA